MEKYAKAWTSQDDQTHCEEEGGGPLPEAFEEILVALRPFCDELGGVSNFEGSPSIKQKVRAEDFRSSYSDYEYVYLTVLGLAKLSVYGEEIVRQNNGRKHTHNPAVQMLERKTGMTMHGDRQGANSVLESAPLCLLKAFKAAQDETGAVTADFFREAFDRQADPCLEGRVGRLMQYLQKKSKELSEGSLPSEDFAIELPTTSPTGAHAQTRDALVGEYLRVFTNSCVLRWAQQEGLEYQKAQFERQKEVNARKFAEICNTATFEVELLARNVVYDAPAKQWEVEVEYGKWTAFSTQANEALERARLLSEAFCEVKIGRWDYKVDLRRMVQINTHTQKERYVRVVDRVRDYGKLPTTDAKADHQESSKEWEVEMEHGQWSPFPTSAQEALERARLRSKVFCQVKIGQWSYEVDLRHMVQTNVRTHKKRRVRLVELNQDAGVVRSLRQLDLSDEPAAIPAGKLSHADVKAALRQFEELQTLPPPPEPTSPPAPPPTRAGPTLLERPGGASAAVTALEQSAQASSSKNPPPVPASVLSGGGLGLI